MFQEPEKYTDNDHFFFKASDDLDAVCNAPKDKDGVFKVIELRNGRVDLVFIGFSKSAGLYSEIVNGLHFDKNPRKLGWTYQLLKDRTDAIDIYWYVTTMGDSTKKVLVDMLKVCLELHGKLPPWNR
jgi:hypothetical protein